MAATVREPAKTPRVGMVLPETESRRHALPARLLLAASPMALVAAAPTAPGAHAEHP